MIEQWGNLRVNIKNGSSADVKLIMPEAMRLMQQVRTEMTLSQFDYNTHSKFITLSDGTFVKASSNFGYEDILIRLPEEKKIITKREELEFAICLSKQGYYVPWGHGTSWLNLYETWPGYYGFYNSQVHNFWNASPWENDHASVACPTQYDARLLMSNVLLPRTLVVNGYLEQQDYKVYSANQLYHDDLFNFSETWEYIDENINLRYSLVERDTTISTWPTHYKTNWSLDVDGVDIPIDEEEFKLIVYPSPLSYETIITGRAIYFGHCGIYKKGNILTVSYLAEDYDKGHQAVTAPGYIGTVDPVWSQVYMYGLRNTQGTYDFYSREFIYEPDPLNSTTPFSYGNNIYMPRNRLALLHKRSA